MFDGQIGTKSGRSRIVKRVVVHIRHSASSVMCVAADNPQQRRPAPDRPEPETSPGTFVGAGILRQGHLLALLPCETVDKGKCRVPLS